MLPLIKSLNLSHDKPQINLDGQELSLEASAPACVCYVSTIQLASAEREPQG